MIVENGNGLSNANSYVTIEYANNYFSEHGITNWLDLEEGKKEIALINGTDFIDNSFKWRGKKATQEQSLSFPRVNIVDNDGYDVAGIPEKLKQAVCEATILSANGTTLFATQNENGAVTSEKIGSLAFTYDINAKKKDCTIYDVINLKLKDFIIETNKSKIYSIGLERV